MGSNEEISCLVERAWSLRGELNREIRKTRVSFCRFCSDNVESERWIAIRDCVKEVENALLFLQKLQAWQESKRSEAQTRLEESRSVLIQLVRNHPGKRTPEVLNELGSRFGSENAGDGGEKPDSNKNWKWEKAVGIAVKSIIFSASMLSLVKIGNSRRKDPSMSESLVMISRNDPLNVFQAKG